MKKFTLSILTVIFIATLTACGGGGSKSSKSDEESNQNLSEKEKMSVLIGYTNSLVQYGNSVSKFADNSGYSYLAEGISKKNENRLVFYSLKGHLGGKDDEEREIQRNLLLEVPDVMSADDKAFLKENVLGMLDTYDILYKESEEMQKYTGRENFKDDDFKQGEILLESIQKNLEELFAYKDMVMGKIGELTENADAILLEGHPLIDQILAMQKINKDIALIYVGIVGMEEKNPEVDVEEVGKLIDNMEAYIDEWKDNYPEAEELKKQKHFYDLYMGTADDVFETHVKAYRAIKNNEKFASSYVGRIEAAYGRLVSRYNASIEHM